jgi:asparagine synthase (glutamine-hydrolysing)
MIERIRHRGPDAQTVQACGSVGLAHARLSIIDLETGAQPMRSVDGTTVIVFNGEIYNYIELRNELVRRGHRFRTQSDTETILAAYGEYGERCVERFNGQFSFAIWDEARRTLFCSRDRLGKKPFYYARPSGVFVFGSEMKAVLTHPSVPRALDLRALDQILTFWCPVPPRTIFTGVNELPPGHTLTLRDGNVSVKPYWQLHYELETNARTEVDYAEELRALLVDAVRLRMLRSDVPVGAYLSGGIDSTVITSMIRRYTDVPLKTFSVSFEDPEFDESRFQREAVAYLGLADHHEALCRAEDIGRAFPDVIWHTEQPIVRTAPAPLFLLSRLVREQDYKVVLTGEGSDEMLGGYDIFKEAKVRRFLAAQPQSRSRPRLLKRLYPYMPAIQSQSPEYLQAFFRARPADLSSPFFSHLPRWELTSKTKMFLSPDARTELNGYRALDELADQLPAAYSGWDGFCQAQYLESTGLLPGYILAAQGDRVQMAHSVEGRCPFLDYRIAEFAARLPPTVKMRVLNEKYLLKRATADLIPPSLQRRPKQPYRSMDVPSFFDAAARRSRFEYVEALLSEKALRDTGLFSPDAVMRLVDKARDGTVIGVKDSMALVAILSTQLTVAQFVTHLRRIA